MQYATSRFGTITVDEAEIIHVQGGLFGFTNFSKYIMVPHRQPGPFLWLQSLEKADLAFPLLDPHLVYPDYLLEISRAEADALGIDDIEQVAIYVVAAARSGSREIRLNMQGPIIVNRQNRQAMQVVDHHCRYSGEIVLAPPAGQRNGAR